jgi:Uma2 family endonuclease
MVKFKIEIQTGNSAYADDFRGELIENLHEVIEKIALGIGQGWIYDSNGNRVGVFRLENNLE